MADSIRERCVPMDAVDSRSIGHAVVDASSGVKRRDFMKVSSIAALGLLASSERAAAKDTSGKTRVTYYTKAERQAVRKNIRTYDWAKASRDEAVTAAKTILSQYTHDDLWRYVGSQNIPRSTRLAGDAAGHSPEASEWGAKYPVDGLGFAAEPGRQWKITNGEYTLPTNDFEAYRQSGLDDRGTFDPARANDSLLVNEEHPEKGNSWGVDDGLGWVDEDGDLGPAGQRWVPVGWAHHWTVVYGYRTLLSTLFSAYLYTNERKYARAASVILDRVGDVYPEFRLQNTVHFDGGGYTAQNGFPNPGHGGTGRGKQLGSIWESYWIKQVLSAYDAVFPAQKGDNELVSFLKEKSKEFPGLAQKDCTADIRTNIETGLIQEVLPAIKNAQIRGNFGSHQTTLAMSAVIQDDPTGYTGDAIDFLFKEGGLERTNDSTQRAWRVTGGDVLPSLLGTFDRDGFPFEGSTHYNSLVKSALQGVGSVLNEYEPYTGTDLSQNVFFKQMFEQQESLVFLNTYVPTFGDSKSAGKPGFEEMMGVDDLVEAHKLYGGTDLAKWIHLRNGETTDGLRSGIFTKKPNAVTDAVKRIIEAEGSLEIDSQQLAGFGFTALRAGDTESNGRAIWTYYGRNGYGPESGYGTSHCHRDTLNIGVYAHGLDLSPDLGYPEETGNWPKRWNWTANTISHNTVLVNEHKQEKQWVSKPKHFDHTDRVQLFDIDASNVYEETEQYRRTTAQIAVDENDSYAVDFFRVDGGQDHHFSFHGAQTPPQTKQQSTSLVLNDGGGEINASSARSNDENTAVEIVNMASSSHDRRGLTVRANGDTTAQTIIDTALSDSQWPSNQSVYLGQDVSGRHVCAGIGCSSDGNPRVGLLYPESGEWGEYEEITPEMHGPFDTEIIGLNREREDPGIDARSLDVYPTESEGHGTDMHPTEIAGIDSKSRMLQGGRFRLTVSVVGVRVEIELTADGSTLVSKTFTLDSTTDDRMGIFGAIDKNRTGRLLFKDFQLDGSPVSFFEGDESEWSGVKAKAKTGITTTGLTLTTQKSGTYAGSDVSKPGHGTNTEYNKSVGNGFNYLHNVRRDDSPDAQFSVDWNIADHWDVLSDSTSETHLRLTMVESVDDVTLADGDPPQQWGNPDTFTYLIAHRSGDDLRSVFTSVIEPYQKSRFVTSISSVPVESADPTARAVKVELASGRTDYVVSASDRGTTHTVGDVFSFQGAFAVYSEDEQRAPEYAYLNDGRRLVSQRCDPPLIQVPSGRIEGTVTDFTRDLCLDNNIEVKVASGLDGQRSLTDVIGAWIYADAAEMRNGAYEIKGAQWTENNRALLDVGQTTTVKDYGEKAKYEYILKPDGRFVIPLSETWTS